jgi:hypothetical protein
MTLPTPEARSRRLDIIVAECLGYLPDYVAGNLPAISFDDGRIDLEESGARTVADDLRPEVRRQLAEAYAWCADRFPLSLRAPGRDGSVRSIALLVVGHSRRRARLLSSSSPQAPGLVFIAADWPLASPYRLASLLSHEDVHQALYVREAESSPVRPTSLGYSPWKGTLRPGRWVWHAFWTFTCQVTLLGESLARDRSLLERDPTLPRFIAEMMARVSVCLYSLRIFDVVSVEEVERCRRASSVLDEVAEVLGGIPHFDQLRDSARNVASTEFGDWATNQLSGAQLEVTERARA